MPAHFQRSDELQAALEAAAAAADIIRHYYRRNLDVAIKDDRTPVTVADVESERAIRSILSQRFPAYGFYGEETGQSDVDAESVWLVDPIDGTKGFVRGYPFFSTQIALLKRGELVLGVSSAPLFDELAVAERGRGAWLNDERISVSKVDRLADTALSTGNLKTLAGHQSWPRLGDLIAELGRIRGYGDFYHYHLLAAGKIDAVVESDVIILDIAALTVIVREAGGTMTDLSGAPIGLDTTSVLAGNPLMHQQILDRLRF